MDAHCDRVAHLTMHKTDWWSERSIAVLGVGRTDPIPAMIAQAVIAAPGISE